MNKQSQKEFTHIRQVIRDLLKTCRPSPDMRLTRVWQIWDQVVEPRIAENAQPVAFKGGLLLVHVTNSPWLQQLRFMEKDLIDQLNVALEETAVSEIRFKIGALS